MHPRRSLPALVILLLSALPLSAASGEVVWRDAPRDVWIDGIMDRGAQVLLSGEAPPRIAIFSARLDRLVILDPERGEVLEAPKSALVLAADRVTATLDGSLRRRGRLASSDDDVHHGRIGRRTILVKPHLSTAGPMALARLLREHPAWAAIHATYEPDAAAVQALAAVAEPTTIRIVLATWCGDSRHAVPRALKALDAAANPNLRVELVGIGPRFQSPLSFVADDRIINVPTIVVQRNGRELGRMIESPATDSVEGDLAAIVAGTLPRHDGRWERERLVASGTYLLRDTNGDEGTEAWRIFETSGGGKLVHSLIRRSGREREIWQRFDERGRAVFVEVTDRTPDETRRTRYRRDGELLRAHSRSNAGGITDQVLPLPEDCGFATGSIVAAAFACGAVDEDGGEKVVPVYAIGSRPSQVTGTIGSRLVADGAGAALAICGETREAWHRVERSDEMVAESWIDRRLGIPLRRLEGSAEATLVELRIGT